MFRESGVVHSFKVVDPVLFVFNINVLICNSRSVGRPSSSSLRNFGRVCFHVEKLFVMYPCTGGGETGGK